MSVCDELAPERSQTACKLKPLVRALCSSAADPACLSPHLDDAVPARGGLITEQSPVGRNVFVLTLCAGAPRSVSDYAHALHDPPWGAYVLTRRAPAKCAPQYP